MRKQESARFCFVCGVQNEYGLGMKFYMPKPGEVTAACTVPGHFQGYPGVVHGGVVAAMLDEVAGRAFLSGDPPRFMLTARLSVRYRRPVPVEKPLHLVGKAKEDKGRVAIAVGEIYDETGQLLAEAEVVLADMPPAMLDAAQMDERDWQVYPDEEEGKG